MGALDSVLSEAESRFGISNNKATNLMSGLLVLVTEQPGGLSSLLDRFRRVGLGDSVSSWLSGGSKPVSGENVEAALGRDTVNNLASRCGLSAGTTAAALAFYVPKVVQRMAPGGVVPTQMPPDLSAYVTGPTGAMASGARQAASYASERAEAAASSVRQTASQAASYAAERAEAAASSARRAAGQAASYASEQVETARRRGVPGFLWPLLGILAILFIGISLWRAREGVTRTGTAFNASDQVRVSHEKANAALAALKPGFSSHDLVDALNLAVIEFPAGSAEITSENYEILNKAAAGIKAAPPGTKIEIAGHTDNQGDSATNQQLSQQRADAVRGYLVARAVDESMLMSRGYGDTKPIASNDTEEGRFRNRRIEFIVIQ